MRRRLLVTFIFLGLATQASPQSPSKLPDAHIRVLEAEVRAGPSSKYPVTGVLHRGAQVFVKKAASSDFLEIVPPPGSVSWIPKAVIEPFGPMIGTRQAFRVVGDRSDPDVPVLPGSIETNGPLEVKDKIEVKRGTQGYLRGPAVKPAWDTAKWTPIDPLPGESRYIAKSAIMDPSPGSSILTSSAKSAPLEPSSMNPASGEELFRQAEQAERDGNFDVAIQLYQRVASTEAGRNFDLANRAATRVFELRRNRPARSTTGTLASRSGSGNSSSASSPAAGGPSTPPLRSGSGSSSAHLGIANPNTNANSLRSSGVGWLRRTGFQIDNKPSFALINSHRQIIYYVTAEPGVDLGPYVQRWVELFGAVEVRGDVRGADYMRVSRLSLVK